MIIRLGVSLESQVRKPKGIERCVQGTPDHAVSLYLTMHVSFNSEPTMKGWSRANTDQGHRLCCFPRTVTVISPARSKKKAGWLGLTSTSLCFCFFAFSTGECICAQQNLTSSRASASLEALRAKADRAQGRKVLFDSLGTP